jgi:hypothetical protein
MISIWPILSNGGTDAFRRSRVSFDDNQRVRFCPTHAQWAQLQYAGMAWR